VAFACRKRNRKLTVFAARKANPLKIERMRALGATVQLEGADFDDAKDAAKSYANANHELYIEDGLIGAIAEGAGTIAVELTQKDAPPLDAIFVPLGNGSLVNGVGTWLKHHAPHTRVIAVCAQSAPAMALSFAARKPVEAPSTSIADGIAVRVPVAEAVHTMAQTVDEVMLVTDDAMLDAMRALHTAGGLVIEPAGAAGVAAIAKQGKKYAGARVASILTGGNLTESRIRDWLY
jgi:threonine dehydratase